MGEESVDMARRYAIAIARMTQKPNAEARQWVADGATLLDVRTPAEFAQGHLPGALNIPVQELPQRVGELPDAERPVVVYCAMGGRSASAAALLKKAGFSRVLDLGPMTAW